MAQFEVLVCNEELQYWLRDKGISRAWIDNLTRDKESIFLMSADELTSMAIICYDEMSDESMELFMFSYGNCHKSQMVIHIADEILASCCRVVLQ